MTERTLNLESHIKTFENFEKSKGDFFKKTEALLSELVNESSVKDIAAILLEVNYQAALDLTYTNSKHFIDFILVTVNDAKEKIKKRTSSDIDIDPVNKSNSISFIKQLDHLISNIEFSKLDLINRYNSNTPFDSEERTKANKNQINLLLAAALIFFRRDCLNSHYAIDEKDALFVNLLRDLKKDLQGDLLFEPIKKDMLGKALGLSKHIFKENGQYNFWIDNNKTIHIINHDTRESMILEFCQDFQFIKKLLETAFKINLQK